MFYKMVNRIKEIEIIVLKLSIRAMKSFFSMPVGTCKYLPTCSEYAVQAIKKYSIIKAFFKITWRIIRCNPLSKGGYDPII